MNKVNLKDILTVIRDTIKRNRVAYKDYLGEETITKTNIIVEGILVEEGTLTLKDSSVTSFVIGESYDVTIDGITEVMIGYELSENSTGYGAPATNYNIIALGNVTDLSNLPSDGWTVAINDGTAVCKTLGSYIGKSISISQTKTITEKHYDIKKLPDELLPNTVAKKTDVTAVKKLATNAQTLAETAQATADNAQTTADNAQSTAEVAKATADNAQATANTAKTTADTAKTTATNAQTAANTAKTTADTAKTTATNAQAVAENAQSTANTAKTTATNAQTTANDAKNIANAAKTTATNAQTTANAAATKANPVFTGTFSQNRKENTVIGSYSHAEGYSTTASGDYSHAEGNTVTASGDSSHAEGTRTAASGDYSHVEGYATTASGGFSHAEGFGTNASGNYSHAEGRNTTAIGNYSHAEGSSSNDIPDTITSTSGYNDIIAAWETTKFSLAKGGYSHVEGKDNIAFGPGSHAEGNDATASGNCSHAEGWNTKAISEYQHAQGKFNIEDSSNTYAHIVGNGNSDDERSNAHTLDWSGNAWFAGTVEGTALIIHSSTSGSTKKFKITVDDSGTISATEIV